MSFNASRLHKILMRFVFEFRKKDFLFCGKTYLHISLTYIATYRIGKYFLSFKCVNSKHSHIADQQECDDLTARFAAIMLGQVDATTRNIGNEE